MKIIPVSYSTNKSFQARIACISDLHGYLTKLKGNFDFVVCSGDFLPDCPIKYNDHAKYAVWQNDWLEANIFHIKNWLQGSPFLFCSGNHDFINGKTVEQILRSESINAIYLDESITNFQGFNFYGFPYVPMIDGSFVNELDHDEMFDKVDDLINAFDNASIDILVSHCPPYKILDDLHHWGNRDLADALDNKIIKDKLPKYVLSGHCHKAHGIAIKNGIVYVNSAFTQNIIEIL